MKKYIYQVLKIDNQWKNYRLFKGFDLDNLTLKMKDFYKINKSLNNEDLTNKKISFIVFIIYIIIKTLV